MNQEKGTKESPERSASCFISIIYNTRYTGDRRKFILVPIMSDPGPKTWINVAFEKKKKTCSNGW